MAFIAQATAMDDIGPFLFVALRFCVASLVVLPFAIIEARRSKKLENSESSTSLSTRDIGNFCLIGTALFAGMATQQVGLLSTSVTNSGFLTGLYVIFTPLIAIALFREKQHPIIWPSAVIGTTGIFFLSGGDLGALVLGDVLTIISAVFWALQMVMIARFVGETGRPLALSLVQFLVPAVLSSILALALEPIVLSNIVSALPEILYTGILGSGVAFTLQVIGQRYTTAPQAAIFLSSEAPFAALFAFLFLGERLGFIGISGCMMILCAMLLVELVPEWQKRRLARTQIS